ncbi:MAG: glycosyltransferase, partial [Epsilonproteobacteria bacterium]|nr:glycosyltransferase [Campylobacterota bacterium]
LAMNHEKYLAHILVAKLFRKRIVIDFYISIYDTQVLDRKLIQREFQIKKLFYIEKIILTLANEVIFLNNAEKEYYCSLLNVDQKRVHIVPLCIEPHKFKEENKNTIPTICWWGSYSPLHGIDNIIEAINLLKKKNFKVKLYIFGDSERNAREYVEKIKKLDLSKEIEVINSYTFKNGKLEEFLISKCDLALGSFGDSDKAKTVLINKLIESTSMKIPVLTMRTKALKEFFSCKDDIFITESSNPQEIAEGIQLIFNNSHKINNYTENAYKVYINNFSPRIFEQKIERVISEP